MAKTPIGLNLATVIVIIVVIAGAVTGAVILLSPSETSTTTTTSPTTTTTSPATTTTTTPPPPPPGTPHDPIFINDNSQFIYANGVTSGTGTASNPYIIKNWVISASSAHGIYIGNTTAYFIVGSCLVENGSSSNHYGIYLDNVKNGKVENSTCKNDNYGIYLYKSCNNNTLDNNTCSNNKYGIYITGSSNSNTITLNYLLNNTENNAYDNCTNSWDNNGKGNWYSDWQSPEHPDAYHNGIVDQPKSIAIGSNVDNYPLVIGWTPFHAPISINDNSQFDSDHCVTWGSGTAGDPYIISNWIISASSAHGIYIGNTTAYFIVRSCLVENGGSSYSGIYLNNVTSGRIENNTCRDDNYGIYLYSSSNNTISNNTCKDDNYSIYLSSSSSNNIISLNNLLNSWENNAYDDGTNAWDNNGKGNYWSDWQPPQHPDNDSNGIVDTAYSVPGGSNVDNYPLVTCKFLGNVIASGYNIPSNFDIYWNQVTPEDAGKWGSVESTRDVMNWGSLDRMYNYAKANGFPFKQHNFVWGQQQPTWVTSLPENEQREEVEEWIRLFGERYPDTDFIDVVNEPLHAAPPFKNALGGDGATGWDWVIWCFEKARQYCPHAKLILNEYELLGGATSDYLVIANLLKERGLIDGIGEQSHASGTIDIGTMRPKLDQLAATGLPIYIAEFDANYSNDNRQLQAYQELFSFLWEHPAVRGVTLWGYMQGKIWRTNAYLIRSDGTERPAMVWLKEYIENYQARYIVTG